MEEELDHVLKKVGGYKPYHLTIFILLSLSCFIPLCYQGLSIVFVGYTPPHHCKVPVNQTLNDTIPFTVENGEIVWDKCNMYVNSSLDNSTMPCTDGWTYYSDGYTTIVTEWDLVCEKNYVSDLLQSIYQFCCLGGEIAFPYFIDKFGRKHLHVVPTILVALTGSAMAFSINLPMFIAIRGITAIIVTACITSGVTLILELFDSKKRTFAGIGLEGGWLIAYLPMALFAWLIPNWRHFQFAISVINIVWICYFWILHESIPWLVVTGKFKKANKVINTTAKWNRVKLENPIKVEDYLKEDDKLCSRSDELDGKEHLLNTEEQCPSSLSNDETQSNSDSGITFKDVLQLVKNPILRKHILVSMVIWFGNCLVYYEITYITPMLPGDRFFNFFIMAVVEIPAYIVSYLIVERYGRRTPMCLFHIGAGLPLLCVPFIPQQYGDVDLYFVTIILVMIAKFCISSSFAIMVLFTKELFPTSLRAISGGAGSIAGRIGNIIAPMIIFLGKTQVYWLPSIVCAVISIVCGLIVLILPDTSNKPLPQTTEDVINWYKKKEKENSNLSIPI